MSEIAYLQLLSPQGPPVRIDANKTMEMATPATPIMQLVEEYGDIVHNPHATPPPYMYTTPKGWPIVQIGFWGPSSSSTTDNDVLQENGCFFNLAACWTRTSGGGVSFTHCEIRFANNYVCSIHEHTLRPPHGERVPGIVHCRQRELDTRNYHFYDLPLRAAEHDAMFRMACAYAADKVPFNTSGMYMNFVCPFRWFPFEAHGSAFFCSELIVTLLQDAGVEGTGHLHPSTTSPNALWDHLTRERSDSAVSFNRNSKSAQTLASLKKPPQKFDAKPFSIPL